MVFVCLLDIWICCWLIVGFFICECPCVCYPT
jgi:hypothetical protein